MGERDLSASVLDPWSYLSHKRTLDGGPDEDRDRASWMTVEDHRRLNAYLLRRAYASNVARHYLVDDGSRDEYREYGDPALFVNQGVSALLGAEQTIVVDGADDYQPERDDQGQIVDDPTLPGYAEAQREEWLHAWADVERLPTKLLEGERQAVMLGDTVYTLGWSTSKRRAVLRVYDPGLYFPVLDDDDPEEFPQRVHMLWEVRPKRPGDPILLRRRTWELGAIGPLTEQIPIDGVLRRVFALFGSGDNLRTVPQRGDRFDPTTGRFTRRYPWQPADEPDSGVTCYYSDATWDLAKLRADWTFDDLPLSEARFKILDDGQLADRIDLRTDFLPVVHVPNTVAGADHYGQSIIDPVAQVFDDISSTDTDGQRAAVIAGNPIIALSGVSAPSQPARAQQRVDGPGEARPSGVQLEAGQVWGLGESGRMDALDMSPQLAALQAARDALRELASVNGRMPSALLGRVKPNEVPSGFALALGFTPFESLLREMRLVRSDKHPLILKMAQRLAQAAGELPPGPTPRAEIRLGHYLPSNESEVIDRIVQMFAAQLVSLETALTLLQAAGIQIDDVQEEAKRIRETDFTGALALFEATGDPAPVYEYLGLDLATAPARHEHTGDGDGGGAGGVPPIDLNTGGGQ